MTRTIESIMANHEHASERRRAGRPIWSSTVKIKQFLNASDNSESAEAIATAAANIARTLRNSLPSFAFDMQSPDYSFSFEDAVQGLEAMTHDSVAFDLKAGLDTTEEFNGYLTEIYDWCDRNRVWVG